MRAEIQYHLDNDLVKIEDHRTSGNSVHTQAAHFRTREEGPQ